MRKERSLELVKASFGKQKVEDFQFDLIERYFRKKETPDCLQVLSDRTCADLDFDDLFMFLDRTTSNVGQQCLYNRLRTIPKDSTGMERKEKLIERLISDADWRISIQQQLESLKKNEVFQIPSLFQEKHTTPPRWFFIIRLLSFTSLLSLVLMPFNPALFLIFLPVICVNLGIHYWNKRNVYRYLGAIPQLLKLNAVADKLQKEPLLQELSLNVSVSIHKLNQVRNRMSFFRLEATLQSDVEAIFWFVLELFKIAFLLEPLLLFGILKRLDSKRSEMEQVFAFVGEVDILISIASLRKGLDTYCLPTVKGSGIAAVQMYHPLISNCIPNSIEVLDKSVLLTGSNMSGKTTFIRTMGINVLTGLTLNTCFAHSMTFPRLRIYSAIRISDDLLNDKSYYFEEVLTIKQLIDRSLEDIPTLFLLDEIFKGTNTIERISAGKAVLSVLTKANNLVFVSTHDIELTELLDTEYSLYHFSELVKDNGVDFDYTLKEGKLKNRNAIRILQLNNYPAHLIDEAMRISEKFTKTSN